MKTVFFIAVLSAISFVSSAQVRFGAKAGVNVANWLTEKDEGFGRKFGLHAGGLATISISDKFSIQPELVYSAQGCETLGSTNDVIKLNTHYVNLPILAQFRTKSGFYLESGPQVGYLLSAKAKSGNETVDFKAQSKSIDLSLVVGLGYQHASGIGVDARFNYGLSTINDGTLKVNNGVIQVGLFYVPGSSTR